MTYLCALQLVGSWLQFNLGWWPRVSRAPQCMALAPPCPEQSGPALTSQTPPSHHSTSLSMVLCRTVSLCHTVLHGICKPQKHMVWPDGFAMISAQSDMPYITTGCFANWDSSQPPCTWYIANSVIYHLASASKYFRVFGLLMGLLLASVCSLRCSFHNNRPQLSC